jgi:DNA invertase Pin-like site-specific DNA recombinase
MYRPNKKQRKQHVLIRALAKAGYGQVRIARIVGIAQSTVCWWLGNRPKALERERIRDRTKAHIKARNQRYRSRPEYKQQRIAYDVAYNIKRAAAEYARDHA